MKKRSVALLMACVMAFGVAVGGTMAWLTDKTDTVTNTFTVGDINIGLTETGIDSTGNKKYDFVPGDTMEKDPKVTVTDSEACWLFVKVIENGNITVSGVDSNGQEVSEKALQYTIADGWKEVPDHPGYWYREVDKATSEVSYYILKDNKVEASIYITKDSALETTKPTLEFVAAAVQKLHIDSVDAAWDELPADFKN